MLFYSAFCYQKMQNRSQFQVWFLCELFGHWGGPNEKSFKIQNLLMLIKIACFCWVMVNKMFLLLNLCEVQLPMTPGHNVGATVFVLSWGDLKINISWRHRGFLINCDWHTYLQTLQYRKYCTFQPLESKISKVVIKIQNSYTNTYMTWIDRERNCFHIWELIFVKITSQNICY